MMKFQPSIIALDFETALWDGSPSLDYYREDFEIASCAIAYRGADGEIKSKVVWGEDETRRLLDKIAKLRIPLIFHNAQYELGCLYCRFPEYVDLPITDTMRLCQMVDNGGKDFVLEMEKTFADILDELEGKKPMSGMSLEACASRIGDKKYYKHKDHYRAIMLERGGDKSSFDLLTKDELGEYNALDAIVTLDLYEKATATLAERGIDWRPDHDLYLSICRLTAQSKIRGVLVDREAADRHIALKEAEYKEIERRFRERFLKEIEEIEQEMFEAALVGYKTEKGREAAKEKLKLDPPRFNIGSTKQLAALFCGKLGLKPKFLTEKGQPSFSSKLLSQWGEGGELLKRRGKCVIERTQGEALKALSEYDGLWHISIKVSSTRSGRLSGG